MQKAYDIAKEFYLSCLVDRQSSKIAFISSTEGGVDIETVAKKSPEKIITTKVDLKKELSFLANNCHGDDKPNCPILDELSKN